MNILNLYQSLILKALITLGVVTALLSCNGDSNSKRYYQASVEINGENRYPDIQNSPFKQIKFQFKHSKLPSNEVFDRNIDYLSLETSKESLVASIDQLIFSKEHIIILDKKTKSVFVFDLNGKFELKINSIGGGPTEYQIPKRIEWNPHMKAIEILDNAKRIIQRYDIETGQHIATLKLGFGIHSFKVISEKKYAFLIDSYLFNDLRYAQVKSLDKQFLIANELEGGTFEFISSHLDYQKNSGVVNHTLNQTLRHGDNDELLANVVFNDTIYAFNEKGFAPKYVFDFSQSIPDNPFAQNDLKKIQRLYKENKIPIIDSFWETKDYLYVNSSFDQLIMRLFISRKTGEEIYLEKSDWMQAALAFMDNPIAANDTALVYIMEPSDLYEVKSMIDKRVDSNFPKADFSRKKEVIDSFYIQKEGFTYLKLLEKGLKEDDNPVLVFTKPNFSKNED